MSLVVLLSFLLASQGCHCSISYSQKIADDFIRNDSILKIFDLLQNKLKPRDSICKIKWGESWNMQIKDNSVYLSIGYLMTYSEGEGILLSRFPYYQLEGHNVSGDDPGYIKLPDNISEFNDYMCGPMNRKGFLCKDCIDGYGPSASSIGFKCSNCTDV